MKNIFLARNAENMKAMAIIVFPWEPFLCGKVRAVLHFLFISENQYANERIDDDTKVFDPLYIEISQRKF